MQKTLFISDLHLDPSRPQVTSAFFDFLKQQARQSTALYILGDFFEAWIGDDDHTPLHDSVSSALADLSSKGTSIYIMHGNRDFLIGEAFCNQAQCTLITDPTIIDLYGTATLLMHGDSLCTADVEYMVFRAKIRSHAMQAQLLAKPIEERRQIAAQLRAQSSESMSNKASDIMDVTPDAVIEALRNNNTTRLIHGHTHRPFEHTLMVDGKAAQRIVLGDWETEFHYIEASEQGVKLLRQAIA